ncbi:MAG: DUF1304 domain-containing protein [Chitinophagales bacterium]|nr:DUF1304 domain-containing protein [Chitinophagales bacterium]MCB9021947.1 DUF1304 domain-containing protein [Chitinophagales bacterium]HPR30174.1 DUF1304 domain-containing protein [Chitinophagales bacterium]HRX23569.1 DUF1304 domain-containing protein [Chitinophagales bacterium]
MHPLSQILVAIVAAEHLIILYMEMFAWETLGRKVFRGALSKELFTPTKVMAANQGLYNGFLAGGLIWSLFIQDAVWQQHVATFFLCCVVVAGLYGGFSASKRIIITQALPAAVALCVLLLA